jgi:ABC-2 type transport system permease protein
VDRLPPWIQAVLNLLPLTHAAHAIRAAAFDQPASPFSYCLLAFVGAVLFILAFCFVNQAKE